MKIVGVVIQKYKERFENIDADLDNGAYSDLLGYEAGKIFYIIFLGTVAMLFYMQQDLIIHQYPKLAITFRIGMCLISIVAIILKVTRFGRNKSNELLMTVMAYHCIMIAILAGTAGYFAAPYISGTAYVMMMFIIAPFSLLNKIVINLISLAVFFSQEYTQISIFQSTMSGMRLTILFRQRG